MPKESQTAYGQPRYGFFTSVGGNAELQPHAPKVDQNKPIAIRASTANLAYYLGTLRIIDKAATQYANLRCGQKEITSENEFHDELKVQIATALMDYHLIASEQDSEVKEKKQRAFDQDWTEAKHISSIYSRIVQPEVKKLAKETIKNPIKFTKSDFLGKLQRVGRATKWAFQIAMLSDEKKQHALNIAGYSQEELEKFLPKLATSIGGFTTLVAIEEGIGWIGGGLAREITSITGLGVEHLGIEAALGIIIASELGYRWTSWRLIQQNIRFLDNPQINNAPDPFAALPHFILKNMLADMPKLRDAIIAISSWINPVQTPRDIAWIATPFLLHDGGITFYTAGNVVNIGWNLFRELGLKMSADKYLAYLEKKNSEQKLNILTGEENHNISVSCQIN